MATKGGIRDHPQILDLRGDKYGRLTVTAFARVTKSVIWECLCDCGKVVEIQANKLRSGHTKSCGCFQEDTRGQQSVTHGATYKRVYHIWATMKQRCQNPKHDKYTYYGGRGIKVCPRWQTFSNFLVDMGEPPADYQIDRIDNDGNYELGNCEWVSRKVNLRKRSNTVLVTFNGKELPLIQLAEEQDIPYHALRRRIKEWRMNPEEAVASTKTMRRTHGKEVTNNP